MCREGTSRFSRLAREAGIELEAGFPYAVRTLASPTISDAELVTRCRSGDADAWRELVERFSRYVYAITMRAYRLPEHDAEDVFQEVFARTYEHLGRLRDDQALRPWIGQLCRRLCVDRLRAASRVELGGGDWEPTGGGATLDELDEALSVHEGLRSLPTYCREILDRFFARDESYRTIADALALPAGTIASRISRCLAKLREVLEGRNEPRAASGES